MKCGAVQQRLWDEGPLPAEVLAHVAACPACAARHAQAAQVFSMLREANPADDPGNLLPEVRERLTRVHRPRRVASLRVMTAVAAAVSTLSLAWLAHAPRAQSPAAAGMSALEVLPSGMLVGSHRADAPADYGVEAPPAVAPSAFLADDDDDYRLRPRGAPSLHTPAVAAPAMTMAGLEPTAAVSVGATVADTSVSEWETRGFNPLTGESTLTRVRTVTDAQGRVIKVEVVVVALP